VPIQLENGSLFAFVGYETRENSIVCVLARSRHVVPTTLLR